MSNKISESESISPVLFNVYMDDQSTSLNNSGIGGHIGEKIINHLCYADDTCLIALSSSAIQQLLSTLCCIMVRNLSQCVLNPVPSNLPDLGSSLLA